MVRRAKSHPKPQRRPHFIKAWRKHLGYSQDRFVETLETMTGMELSKSQFSRIERGEQPYHQDQLEAFAVVMRQAPDVLLRIDPTGGPEPIIYSIWETLTPVQRRQMEQIAETLKTGTED